MKKTLPRLFRRFLPPLLPALLYALLASFNLSQSIWFDESYSAMLIRFNFGDIWQLTGADVHPPLYYFALKIWSFFFGTSDVALRFMSVFFGILTIFIIYAIIERWLGSKKALFTSFCIVFSAFLLRFGQEMRMYTMVAFFVALSVLFLTLMLDTHKLRFYLAYGVTLALGLWTHYFTVFAWLAQFIFLLFYLKKRFFTKKLLSSYLLAFLLFLPWFPEAIAQTQKVQHSYWIPPVNLDTIKNFFANNLVFLPQAASDYRGNLAIWIIIVLVFSACLFLLARVSGLFPRPSVSSAKPQAPVNYRWFLLLALAFLPPLFLFLCSLPPLRSLFVNRYLIYSVTFVWVLVATVLIEYLTHLLTARAPFFSRVEWPEKCAWIFLVLFFFLFSLANGYVALTRPSDSRVKNVVTALSQLNHRARNSVPLLSADELFFYQALPYSTNNLTVHTITNWYEYPWVPHEPLAKLEQGIIYPKLDDFLVKHERFWFVQSFSSQKNLYNNPHIVRIRQDFLVLSEQKIDNYLVTEFIRRPSASVSFIPSSILDNFPPLIKSSTSLFLGKDLRLCYN